MATDAYSSQRDESLVTFSIKILLPIAKLETQVTIDCAEYRGRALFTWRRRFPKPRILFSDIITTAYDSKHPYTAEGVAREEAVSLFWAQQMQRFFYQTKIKSTSRTSENLIAASKLVARSFAGNYGLPLELILESDQLLPETTKRCDWEGLRENIISPWPNDGDQAPSKTNKK